jgi:hypothetical protein
MKVTLEAGERPALLDRLGLAAKATDAEIGAAIESRLTGTPAPAAPAPAATATDPDAEAVIGQAVRDGKFAAERADHWRQKWARDPGGTRKTLARLQSGVVLPQAAAGDSYPPGWVPELDRPRQRVTHGGD